MGVHVSICGWGCGIAALLGLKGELPKEIRREVAGFHLHEADDRSPAVLAKSFQGLVRRSCYVGSESRESLEFLLSAPTRAGKMTGTPNTVLIKIISSHLR